MGKEGFCFLPENPHKNRKKLSKLLDGCQILSFFFLVWGEFLLKVVFIAEHIEIIQRIIEIIGARQVEIIAFIPPFTVKEDNIIVLIPFRLLQKRKKPTMRCQNDRVIDCKSLIFDRSVDFIVALTIEV